jgi:lipopolysaccharide biosynthesis regulator YciM
MAQKRKSFNVEISDIFEPEQEDFVIDKVVGFMKQNVDELKDYFTTTDTIVVKRISEDDAKNLCEKLKNRDLAVRMYDVQEKKKEREAEKIRCPKCGFVLEFPEWRCPDCYYEFPDFGFEDDTTA